MMFVLVSPSSPAFAAGGAERPDDAPGDSPPSGDQLINTGNPYTLAIAISVISLLAGIILLIIIRRNNRSDEG